MGKAISFVRFLTFLLGQLYFLPSVKTIQTRKGSKIGIWCDVTQAWRHFVHRSQKWSWTVLTHTNGDKSVEKKRQIHTPGLVPFLRFLPNVTILIGWCESVNRINNSWSCTIWYIPTLVTIIQDTQKYQDNKINCMEFHTTEVYS